MGNSLIDDGSVSYQSLVDIYVNAAYRPNLIVCDARSDGGKFILENRDGEMDFDGFHHAYVKRDEQLFLVPLWEWAE